MRCNPNQFYRGDLVEAIATVDIAVEPAEDTVPRTSIYLSFNRVTCVLYADKLEQVRSCPHLLSIAELTIE